MDAEFIRDDSKKVVIDNSRNLMWQDNSDTETANKDWQGAMNYCQNLNFAGYDDWHLPSRDELLTLATLGFYGTAYDKNNSEKWYNENKHKRQKFSFVDPVFQNMPLNMIWSSTTHPSDSTTAWYVNFNSGSDDWYYKTRSQNVRCVRDSKNDTFKVQVEGATSLKEEAILSIDTGGHTAHISDIIVTKSGDIISASLDKTIRVWDSKTGKEKRKILGQIENERGMIYAIALSPDEKYLAVGGNFQNDEIRLYDYQSGKLLTLFKSHSDVVHDLTFSQDGRYLASGSGDKTVKLWDIDNYSLYRTILFHKNNVFGVAFDNNNIISVGLDSKIALHSLKGKL